MGLCLSSDNRGKEYAWESDPMMFMQKMKLLQQEINGIMKQREEEVEVYERELMVFAYREKEWRREQKRLRDEVKHLRGSLEEKEDRIRRMEQEIGMSMAGKCENVMGEHSLVDRSIGVTSTSLLLVEHMREERARRDETVDKWKMLYLAIKHELDDLIERTHEGTLYWRAEEEDLMEDLQRELKAKDETIQVLKLQLASMKDEEYRNKREVDILRQSLRIMSSNNSNKAVTSSSALVKRQSKPLIRFTKNFSKLAFV